MERSSRPADQRCARHPERVPTRPSGESPPVPPLVIPNAPPATLVVPEVPPVGSFVARDVSSWVEKIGENARDPNDHSYLGWDPKRAIV